MEVIENWHSHYNILIFDSIDSTNEEAKRIAKNIHDGEYVIWSYAQYGGKGRSGKKWYSPKNNLYLSILLRSGLRSDEISYIPFLMALVAADFIKKHLKYPERVQLKWPNDVYYEGKKIAGILIETQINPRSGITDWLVIGCGINLVDFPENVSHPATSIYYETGKTITVEQSVDELMRYFVNYLQLYNQYGFAMIREKWLSQAYGINSPITATTSNNRISGTFKDISANGSIVIQLHGNKTVEISSGEVFF